MSEYILGYAGEMEGDPFIEDEGMWMPGFGPEEDNDDEEYFDEDEDDYDEDDSGWDD